MAAARRPPGRRPQAPLQALQRREEAGAVAAMAAADVLVHCTPCLLGRLRLAAP